MRDIGRRLRALEEAKAMADLRSRPLRTLADFYAAISSPNHPENESTRQSLAHFHGGRVPDTWQPNK